MDLDKIILNVLNNKASKEEYEILEAWKKESNDNLAFLKELKEKASAHTGEYKEYDVKKAWDKIDPQITESGTPPKSPSKLWLLGLVLLLVGAAIFYFVKAESGPNVFDAGDKAEQFATTDNSAIWLNAHSHLAEVSDFTETREVDLNGEAFFDVVSDKERPFIININETEYIQVVGTSFNVLNNSSDFDISVYSGHVQLHVLGRVIDLHKNDRVKRVDGSYVKVKNTQPNVLSWKTKTLVFDNTPLSEVLSDLENHFKVKFNYSDRLEIGTCSLRSKFENESIETVMAELVSHFNIQYNKDKNNINITGIKCD